MYNSCPSNSSRVWQFYVSPPTYISAMRIKSSSFLPSRLSPSLRVSKLAMLKVYPSRQQNQTAVYVMNKATQPISELKPTRSKHDHFHIVETLLVIVSLLAAAHALRPAALARPHHVVRRVNLGLEAMHSLNGGPRLCAVVIDCISHICQLSVLIRHQQLGRLMHNLRAFCKNTVLPEKTRLWSHAMR